MSAADASAARCGPGVTGAGAPADPGQRKLQKCPINGQRCSVSLMEQQLPSPGETPAQAEIL